MTAWQIRSFPGLNLPNSQTKHSHHQLNKYRSPTRPQSRDYPECLVLIISPKLLIVGSGWVEIVSLCLINTYLIMVNYYCLIIEEQSCQSPDMKKPSGSLITICWHLAPGWAVRGPETGRCLHCVTPPPSTDSWVNTSMQTPLAFVLYLHESTLRSNTLYSITTAWKNNPIHSYSRLVKTLNCIFVERLKDSRAPQRLNKTNKTYGTLWCTKEMILAIMPVCPC